MRIRFAPAAAATVAVVAAAAGAARAQIMSNPGQWYTNNQVYSMRVFNGLVSQSMLRAGKGKSKGTAATGKGKTAPAAAASPTTFREDPKRSLSGKLARGAVGDPAEAERALRAFLKLYRDTARKDGFPANDLAYAFEYFVVNNYNIAHDLMELPPDRDPAARNAVDGFDRIAILGRKRARMVTPYQERAVYDQFRALLGASPAVRKMTDAQKQEAAELLAVLVGVNVAAYLGGIDAGDERATEEARRTAREGLRRLTGGASADSLKITNEGVAL